MGSDLNPQRIAWIREHLERSNLDAIVCTLPVNVLMLTGYWPVVGTSVGVATREGQLALLLPEDEADLLKPCWVEDTSTFSPASLETLRPLTEIVGQEIAPILRRLGVANSRIGYEVGPASEPSSYAAMNLYGGSIVRVLQAAVPNATLVAADEVLAELTAVKTPLEVERIRRACEITGMALDHAVRELWTGMREMEAVSIISAAFNAAAAQFPQVQRTGAFFFCMSGPNAAKAAAAYARTRRSVIEAGETVMVHCNTHAEGYWTDITRTYVLGEPTPDQRRWYNAVFEARDAALASIRPGVRASAVDNAARSTLQSRELGSAFPHSTGHGVGFSAISANARPRIHPKSDEVLRHGMVFNVEPAVYFDGVGGVRQCEMVAVTDGGAELLTSFQGSAEKLWQPVRSDKMLRTG